MSEGNGKAPPPWAVQFEITNGPDGPAARWTQNREPNLLELALFQSELVVRLFRGAITFAQVQDAMKASGLVGPDGGPPKPGLIAVQGGQDVPKG